MILRPQTSPRATMLSSRITPSLLKCSRTPKPSPIQFVVLQSRAISILSSPSNLKSQSSKSRQRFPKATIRFSSTSPTASPTLSSSQSSASITPQTLTWDRFLRLRAVRRTYNLVSSVLSSLTTAGIGMTVLSTQDFEKLSGLLFGLDPIMALGLLTLGSGAVGWLLGPFAGNAAFGMAYRRLGGQMAVKEKEFYQHIKRCRADPTGQSVNNPVPDYYGEKISSIGAYRQWLKDQRAFRKKRESY